MKHPKLITMKLLVWVVFASAFAWILLPKFALSANEMADINPLIIAGVFILAVTLGTIFWLKFGMKKHIPEVVFTLGIGLAFGRMVSMVLSSQSIWLRLGVVIVFMVLYGFILTKLKTGSTAPWYFQLNNFIMATSTVVIGGMVGALFPLWIGILLFGLFAIYDAIAVWKTGHMVTLAKTFIEKGIIPGIAYPYENAEGKQDMALLGGGDIMFIAFVGASFARTSMVLAAGAMIGMTIAVCLLFWFSTPKKFYPALPFLFAGMLIAFPVWWMFA